MILYSDNKVIIQVDKEPKPIVRYEYNGLTKDEIAHIRKYPFINKQATEFHIQVLKENKIYTIYIPKNYPWDGATIPRLLWRLIGSKSQPEFLLASMVHDFCCENKEVLDYDRKLSTYIFKCLLKVTKVSKWRIGLMCFFVELYQSFFW